MRVRAMLCCNDTGKWVVASSAACFELIILVFWFGRVKFQWCQNGLETHDWTRKEFVIVVVPCAFNFYFRRDLHVCMWKPV